MDRRETSEIIIFSFTREGTYLNRKWCGQLVGNGKSCSGYAPSKYVGKDGTHNNSDGTERQPADGDSVRISALPEDLKKMIGDHWGRSSFVFIGAAGIAVRSIAPYVKDKFTDSPVLVADERGQYIIPILSGHIGGGVELADEIALLTGAVPIHTTATDVRRKFAVDVFAKKNSLRLLDRAAAKEISAAVLEGERIAFWPDYQGCRIMGEIPEELILCRSGQETEQYRYRIIVTDRDSCEYKAEMAGTLILRPENIIVGIGCRRGIRAELLEQGLADILAEHGLVPEQIEAVASIDLKREEPAVLALTEKYKIPFFTYPAEELRKIQNVTQRSDFVQQTTGVDNVCERAALRCCPEGILIQGKCTRDSMTAALVRRPVEF